jgi:NTP pyrophosphatase (non-canonical NTP hydrolase)
MHETLWNIPSYYLNSGFTLNYFCSHLLQSLVVVPLSHRRWTLPEYTALFKEIFEIRYMSLTNEQILQRLVEEIAEIVKPVYVSNLERIKWVLPDIIAWICAFADKCHIDLGEIMCKYIENPPGKLDLTTIIKPQNIIRQAYPETFEDWQLYLAVLYRNENANIAPSTTVLKILEDIGKTSRSLRIGSNIAYVKKHLAGVLAWTITLANKFDIKIDDVIYNRYPNKCARCQSKPCKCFGLSTMFISYAEDTTKELLSVKDLLTQLDLKTEAFDRLGPDFYRINMSKVFNAIYKSDGAIMLLKDQWSEKDRAELLEIFNRMDEKNVWIFVKKGKKTKINELKRMLEEIEQFHKIHYYSDEKQLVQSLRKGIQIRVGELKEIAARIPAKQ